ncbi:MAG: SufD family Fe-S cluster assembly protein [Patescibacteria group bacterium]
MQAKSGKFEILPNRLRRGVFDLNFPHQLNSNCLIHLDKSIKKDLQLNFSLNSGATVRLIIYGNPENINCSVNIKQAAGSQLIFYSIIAGTKKIINKLNVDLNQRAARFDGKIFYFGTANDLQEQVTKVEHRAPATFARVSHKRVQIDKSQTINYGMIKVDKKADKTDTLLSDRTLLLGKNSSAEFVPSLEILTSNVKASHQASCGQISNQDIFYLQSRGLSISQAQKLIISGFIKEILPSSGRITNWLSKKTNNYV